MKSASTLDDILVPNREAAERMELTEFCFPGMMRKSVPGSVEISNEPTKSVHSPACIMTLNSFFEELESDLRLSSPVIEPDSQKWATVDLKLGKLTGWKGDKTTRFSNERVVVSSEGSSLLGKRVRTEKLCVQTPVCQVHGCNKDLSSSKDYHKRHKVCDVHSKTAIVIVNGIEQRFCQQCSRFHLLGEFDDGKRSCRKRLAGHNERRRKPQLGIPSGKPMKLLQYYPGARFLGSSLPERSSSVFPNIPPGGFLCPERCEKGNQCRHIKLDEDKIYNPPSGLPISNGQALPKSFLDLHCIGNQYPSESFSSITHYPSPDMASSIQESSGFSTSRSALSLLSAESRGFSSHSTDMPTAVPLIVQGELNAHQVLGQNSSNPLCISVLENYVPNGFFSSGMDSALANVGPPMLPDNGISVNFEVQKGGIFPRSDAMDSKYCLSPESGPTVDLLQLSTHLQRVEQHRNYVQVKQENDIFCCSSIT
ncbi:unnamed protein product [Ilex paraguariensis]|uniref:SBP-type domain-containing protein n=1 Tax=Ilex paraguariensis TaxID=185542 RepID=A0ABC8RIC9_9AQUA